MAKWDKPSSLGGGGSPQTESFVPGLEGDATWGPGVLGQSGSGPGVRGHSNDGAGVEGTSDNRSGVHGDSTRSDAVVGITHANWKAGVLGITDDNAGWGAGVVGYSKSSHGIHGVNGAGAGQSELPAAAGVWGESDNGYGVYGASKNGFAGHFEGNVEVNGEFNHNNGNFNLNNGNLNIVSSGDVILSDCAEPFDAADEKAGPGSVMVINQDGKLRQCAQAYDKTVAGVVSGAGNFRPGLVLGKRRSEESELLIALLGKVYCKVDARHSPVEVGDLLTTSSTPGHAMKADDPAKAFGCVIGKALRPLHRGQGLVPILIALQ